MNARPSIAAAILAVLVTAVVAVLATCLYLRFETVTLVSLSPDDNWRVHLVERNPPLAIDRNFRVRLERLADHSVRELFQSPDEGLPVGSERILWSPDSTQFVLVGRHFSHNDKYEQLPSGESLYLLYDIPSGRLRCNATQGERGAERFTRSDCPWLESAPATACPTFFSRALEATVENEHLTIVVPENAALVDSVYVDETSDLPVEVRCESPGDREILAYHLTFRADNAALDQVEDERFKLLHTQEKLAEPVTVCIVQRSTDETTEKHREYSIRSASIERKEGR